MQNQKEFKIDKTSSGLSNLRTLFIEPCTITYNFVKRGETIIKQTTIMAFHFITLLY